MLIRSVPCISQVLLGGDRVVRWTARCLITLFSLTYKAQMVICKGALLCACSLVLKPPHFQPQQQNKSCIKKKKVIGFSQENCRAQLSLMKERVVLVEEKLDQTSITILTWICHEYLILGMVKTSLFMKIFKETNSAPLIMTVHSRTERCS